MYNFNGKVALITGGSDGIGLAAAKSFIAAGARVMVVGRDAGRGQRALAQLVAGGAIVNVSSVNGFASSPKAAIYSATKHGMNGLTTAAAREYIGKGIRINSVCPGAIETPRRQRRLAGFTAEQVTAHYADLAERVPAGRVGRAEEVAAGILWLCSDESSYVVGHHLVIDGGLSA